MTTTEAGPTGIGRILNSPIAAFAPFIIMSLFSSPSNFLYAAGLAALTAVVVVVGNWQLNHIPAGQLDWAALILFGLMLIVGLADDGAHDWLSENANLMSDITVMVITAGGMAIGRPFALMYARLSPGFAFAWEQDREGFRAWGVRACQIMSLFWLVAFAVQLVCQLLTQFGGASYHNALWDWIIPLVAFVLVMIETRRYTEKMRSEGASFGQSAASS